jgi:hypothetical protein
MEEKYLKKLLVLSLCVVLASTSIVTASPLFSMTRTKMQTPTVLDPTGTFDGSIGYQRQGNWTEVGTISGTYELQNRFSRFNGEWSIQLQNRSATGTMRGGFGRHILIGRITIEGRDRALPIIGFIGFRNETFFGRFMSLIGPALYFQGTYT